MRQPILADIIPQGQLTRKRHCQKPIHPRREHVVVGGQDVENAGEDASEGLEEVPGHAPGGSVEFDFDLGTGWVVGRDALKEVAF